MELNSSHLDILYVCSDTEQTLLDLCTKSGLWWDELIPCTNELISAELLLKKRDVGFAELNTYVATKMGSIVIKNHKVHLLNIVRNRIGYRYDLCCPHCHQWFFADERAAVPNHSLEDDCCEGSGGEASLVVAAIPNNTSLLQTR